MADRYKTIRAPKTGRIIAPRLMDGDRRLHYSGGLPPEVREGLWRIAIRENQSVSWVLEQVIIDYFDLRRPKYKKREKQVKEKVA
jgi:hypothetical protein